MCDGRRLSSPAVLAAIASTALLVLRCELATRVMEIDFVERRPVRRDRLYYDSLGLERREDGRDRACAARDPAANAPAVDRRLEHAVERGDDRLGFRCPPVVELDLDGLAAEALLQLLGRSLDDDSAAADD